MDKTKAVKKGKKLTLVSVIMGKKRYSGFFMLDRINPSIDSDDFYKWLEKETGMDFRRISRGVTITIG